MLQDPLYLPSNSELQVSMWRLTNQRQVWYEWSAEAFLPVAGSSSLRDREESQSMFLDASPMPSILGSPSSLSRSPLVDAVPLELPSVVEKLHVDTDLKKPDVGLIKIGQTALHNPRGRSSWIGL